MHKTAYVTNTPDIKILIPMSLLYRVTDLGQWQTLLDTGAQGGNFILASVVNQLVSLGAVIIPTRARRVCSCFGECKTLDKAIVVDCNLKLPGNHKSFLLKDVEFLINEDLPYEVIVGLDTINKHQLLVYRRDDATPHPGQMESNSPGTISLIESDYE